MSLNKVMLIGNLGADPEMRYTANGQAVANLRLATTERWGGRDGGEQKEKTEWHRVIAFGRTAEAAAEYLRKGSKAYIEGRIQTREWEDKQGQKRWTTEIVASQVLFLDGRRGGEQREDGGGYDPDPGYSSGSGDIPF